MSPVGWVQNVEFLHGNGGFLPNPLIHLLPCSQVYAYVWEVTAEGIEPM